MREKYRVGERITSLEALKEPDYIYLCIENRRPKLYHMGWYMSWQFRVVCRYMDLGYIYEAVKVQGRSECSSAASESVSDCGSCVERRESRRRQ